MAKKADDKKKKAKKGSKKPASKKGSKSARGGASPVAKVSATRAKDVGTTKSRPLNQRSKLNRSRPGGSRTRPNP